LGLHLPPFCFGESGGNLIPRVFTGSFLFLESGEDPGNRVGKALGGEGRTQRSLSNQEPTETVSRGA